MKFYHGSKYKNLKLLPHITSRYGFAAFFATPDRDLAIKYSYFNYQKFGSGFLYAFEANEDLPVIDFQNKISHSYPFRNLIYQLKNEHHEAVLIKNVIDYPNEELAVYKTSTILIIFNLEIITNLKMIGKY